MTATDDEAAWQLRSLSTRINLTLTLPAASAESARAALQAFSRHDDVQTALFAASAVELLSKATILRQEPGGLGSASRAGRASSNFLRGVYDPAVSGPYDLITLKFRDAVRGAWALTRRDEPTADIDLLRAARDAAVHLAYSDTETSIAAIGAMVRLGIALLPLDDSRLQDWLDTEDQLLTDALGALTGDLAEPAHTVARVRARLWTAARRWNEVRRQVPEVELQEWSVRTPNPHQAVDSQLRFCAVGGHLAWFAVERSDELTHDDDGWTRELVLDRMACVTCGMYLHGPYEFAVLGLTPEVVGWEDPPDEE